MRQTYPLLSSGMAIEEMLKYYGYLSVEKIRAIKTKPSSKQPP